MNKNSNFISKINSKTFVLFGINIFLLSSSVHAQKLPNYSDENQDLPKIIRNNIGEGNQILSYPLIGKSRRGGNIILIDKSLNYEVGIVDPKDPEFSSVYKTAKTSDLKYKLMAGWSYAKNGAKQTKLHFGTEFTKLFLAGYYPIAMELALAYHKGPLALKEQLDSLAHPMGYVGLASFMLANRITSEVLIDLKTKEVPRSLQYKVQDILKNSPRPLPTTFKDYRSELDFKTKKKVVDFLPISQIGMATGMLAQHIVSDTYSVLKQCFFRPRQKILTEQQMMIEEQKHDMACDAAVEEVNLENYSSGITSLVLSSFISAGITEGFNKGVKAAGALANEALMGNSAYTKTLFLGGAIVSRLNMAGNIVIGMNWVYQRILKNLNGMGIFFMVDSIINEPIKNIFGNYLRANQNTFNFQTSILPKIENIESALNSKIKINSNKEALSGSKHLNKDSPNDVDKNLQTQVEELSKSLELWRNFKLRSFQYAHASWETKTENVRLLTKLSEDFYHDFLYDLYLQNKRSSFEKDPSLLEKSGLNQHLMSFSTTNLDRLFPFFGLTPFNVFQSQHQPLTRYLSENSERSQNFLDLYTQNYELTIDTKTKKWDPAWLERYQYNVLFDLADKLYELSLKLPTQSKAHKTVTEFAKDLNRKNWSRDGEKRITYDKRVKSFIQYVKGLERNSFSTNNGTADQALETLYKLIGKPQILDGYAQGFSKIYYWNSEKQKKFATSEVKIWSGFLKSLNGSHITDYLIYNMACGPSLNDDFQKFISAPTAFGYDLLYDTLNPPRLVADGIEFDICLENSNPFKSGKRHELTNRLNRMYTSKVVAQYANGKEKSYDGIYAAIVQNLRGDILNLIRESKFIGDATWPTFMAWWASFETGQLEKIRSDYKLQYGKLVEELLEDLRDGSKWTNFSSEDYVAHGVLSNLSQEIRFYVYLLLNQNSRELPNKDLKEVYKNLAFPNSLSSNSQNSIFFKKIENILKDMEVLFNKIKVKKVTGGRILVSDVELANLQDFKEGIDHLNQEILNENKGTYNEAFSKVVAEKLQDRFSQIRALLLNISLFDWQKMKDIEDSLKDERVIFSQD